MARYSDLLVAKGNAQADAVARRGAIYGDLAARLGQAPGQVLAMGRQRESVERQRAQQDQALELGRQQLDEGRVAAAGRQQGAAVQAILGSDVYDERGLIDVEKAASLAAKTNPALVATVRQTALKLNESALDYVGKQQAAQTANQEWQGNTALALLAGGTSVDPGAFHLAVGQGAKLGRFSPDEAERLLGLDDEAEITRTVQSWAQGSAAGRKATEPVKLGRGDLLVQPGVGGAPAKTLASGAPEKPPDAGSFEDFVTRYARDVVKKPVEALTSADIEKARARYAEAGSTREPDTALDLSPEALALTARQYAMTGQLPPMGMGKQGAAVRTKIINEAAKQYASLDMPTQIAAWEANKRALTQLTTQRAALGAFESTALKNLEVFLDAAAKIPDTGIPILNQPIRALSENVLGGPTLTAFQTARRTVIPEFAKILANPGLSGQLSDSARHEVEEVVSGKATLKQMIAAAKVLKQDTHNRAESYDEQIAAIQKLIATPPASSSTPKTITVTPPAGGTGYTFPTQAAADAFVADAKAKGLWK